MPCKSDQLTTNMPTGIAWLLVNKTKLYSCFIKIINISTNWLLLSYLCFWFFVRNSAFVISFHELVNNRLLQSCLTLCNPIKGSPPGSSVPGILQARTPEWVAISFSNAWKWKMKVKSESEVAQSCLTLSDPMDCSLPGYSVHGILQARVLEWVVIALSMSYLYGNTKNL